MISADYLGQRSSNLAVSSRKLGEYEAGQEFSKVHPDVLERAKPSFVRLLNSLEVGQKVRRPEDVGGEPHVQFGELPSNHGVQWKRILASVMGADAVVDGPENAFQ
jgi:hypothetical protein